MAKELSRATGLPTDTAQSEEPMLLARLAQLPGITLTEMDDVSLLDRTDTKYLLSKGDLPAVITAVEDFYRVLEVEGTRLTAYRTLYFDTEDLALYRRHHAGDQVRFKIRSREYLQSGQAFFEVKSRTNKGRTIKDRLPTDGLAYRIEGSVEDFLTTHPGEAGDLRPTLLNEFDRITVVSPERRERVTVDLNIRFSATSRSVELPSLVIVEVKQGGFDRSSPVLREMRAKGVQPQGVSKYCLGISLLYEDVKHNAFKPRLLQIEKLMKEPIHVR